jgi:hypothetical protein
MTLARLHAELGERRKALDVLEPLEAALVAGAAPEGRCLAATSTFDAISPRGDLARWALASVIAARLRLASFSCVYGPHDPTPYQRFLDLGYRDDEMARRLELVVHRKLLGVLG